MEKADAEAAERAKEHTTVMSESPPQTPSSASLAAHSRLERAQSRFSLRHRSHEGGDRRSERSGPDAGIGGGGQTFALVGRSRAVDKALAATTKAGDAMEPLEALNLVSAGAAIAAARWSEPWRAAQGSGVQGAEMSALCGFTADCLALHPDGETLVGIGGDGDPKSVSVYSAREGRLLQSMHGHSDKICSVAVDEKLIASGSRDRTIKLWNMADGKCLATLAGCEDLVHGLALRGDILLSGEGGGKKAGRVASARLWSVRGCACVGIFAEHTASIFGVALGADIAVTASHDTTARLWPIPEGEIPASKSCATLRHPAFVHSVSIAEGIVATGCGDGKVRVWTIATRKCELCLVHSTVGLPISTVRLQGGLIASGGEDCMIKVWALQKQECIATLSHGDFVKGIALSVKLGVVAGVGGLSSRLNVWSPGRRS